MSFTCEGGNEIGRYLVLGFVDVSIEVIKSTVIR